MEVDFQTRTPLFFIGPRGHRLCYSLAVDMRLVDNKRLYSKWARILFGVLFLLCAGQIISASSRQLPTLVDQSASAINTQSDSSQAGADKSSCTHRPPRSSIPHSVEITAASPLNHVSYEPQPVHRLAAEIIEAFELANLTHQGTYHYRAPSNYFSVIVSYSSGRSPPHQV
jgi:hypothetical protein